MQDNCIILDYRMDLIYYKGIGIILVFFSLKQDLFIGFINYCIIKVVKVKLNIKRITI